jgi:outer membrane lipoprotein-sorting protein
MMSNARSTAVTACLLAVLLSAPGCLVRRRVIARRQTASGAPRPLLTASREELIQRLRSQYSAVHSFNATVDMTPALGSVYKGEITEYKDIRAYVLYRQPTDFRIIGLVPVLRNKAFDMVAMGNDFRIFIPSKNKFVEGKNDAPPLSKNSLENLRPEAFLEAMLIPPPDLSKQYALLLDSTDEEQALYVLILEEKTEAGDLTISRTIFFDRETLQVTRQKKYDRGGSILSDSRYQNWTNFNGVQFPKDIDINHPQDGYGVVMDIVKMEMNVGVGADKFVLEQPAGTQLQVIGDPAPPKDSNK